MHPALFGLPRLKLDPAIVNVVDAGDSLTTGLGGNGVNGDYPAQQATFAGMNGIVPINAGHAGERISDFITNQATWIDVYFDPSKTNVLNLFLGTNSIYDYLFGAHTTQAVALSSTLADMNTLITNVQAAAIAAHSGKKWIINLFTLLAREIASGQTDTDTMNAVIDAVNANWRTNYRAMGAKGLCNLRAAGSPFNPPSYTQAAWETWATGQGLFVAGEISGHGITHNVDAGYLQIANINYASMLRLPAR